jgi:hypothetical protein
MTMPEIKLMTATQLQEQREAYFAILRARPTFRSGVFQPRIDVSRYLKPMEDALLDLILHGTAMVTTMPTGQMVRCDLRAARLPEPKPAKPHPLQKLSSTPNGWGQSMWRPWE